VNKTDRAAVLARLEREMAKWREMSTDELKAEIRKDWTTRVYVLHGTNESQGRDACLEALVLEFVRKNFMVF